MRSSIQLHLNGRPVSLDTDDSRKLLWVLRTDLGLTGAKYACGARTVLLDGRAVRSCVTPLSAARDREVTTIEGLERGGVLHPLPRFSALPKIETVLVRNDEVEPQGAGEPTIVPLGGAVANALFDATGKRLYRLPLTPERVNGALAS